MFTSPEAAARQWSLKPPTLLLLASVLSVAGVQSQEARIVVDKSRPEFLRPVQMMPPASNVRASPSPSHVYLRWTCPAGATGFEVLATPAGGQQAKVTSAPIPAQCVLDVPESIRRPVRLPGPPGTAAPSNTTTYSTFFQHNGLRPGQEFAYVVRALYPNGIGDAAPVTAVTPPWPAPTGVQVRVQSAGPPHSGSVVVVSWNTVHGAPGYEVWATSLYEGEKDRLVTLAPVTGTTFTDQIPIGVKGYYVKTLEGLASQTVDVAW